MESLTIDLHHRWILIVIMSSSDSDFEVGENSCFGYQYKPEYTEEELAAAAALMKNRQTKKKMKQLIKYNGIATATSQTAVKSGKLLIREKK
jgi:hypothetical protein